MVQEIINAEAHSCPPSTYTPRACRSSEKHYGFSQYLAFHKNEDAPRGRPIFKIMKTKTEYPAISHIEELAKLTAELRKKVQQTPTSLANSDQLKQITNVENSILRFQRDLWELAQAVGIKTGKEFWWPQ
ncbi:hypothetical protein LCGC14_0390670 [marine sediment metagenome]|uniref:Uncharacterized protein n=1 Tax=marine sediment metagenome TaxID=412755 RepID=A0A0F9THR3_9ZZZZ